MKKVLSVLLALCLLLGMVPVFAFAAEDEFNISNGMLISYKGPGGHVDIPDGVRYIGYDAFRDNTNITSVSFPASVEQMAWDTDFHWKPFDGCVNLTQIIVSPENKNFTSVDGILYSKDMKTLELCPSGSAPAEGHLMIPDGVTNIALGAIIYNDNITKITIPASVTQNDSILYCNKLSEIIVDPENTVFASKDGVMYSKDMKELEIYPSGITSASFTMPKGVTKISRSAFYGSKNLKDIKLPDGLKEIDILAFAKCSSLVNINIPNSVSRIGYSAFWGCSSLVSVIVPEGLTLLDEGTFSGCTSLTSVTIPSSITKLYFAFGRDNALKDIYYGGTKEQWEKINFYGSQYEYDSVAIHFNTTPPAPSTGFTDVKSNAYYAEAVKWAVENGITSGLGGGKFAPAQTCKREQIVTFLYRSKGSPDVTVTSQFTDMPKSQEFQKAISWAVENGITMGNGKGKFLPEKGCTRAEAMTFIWRAAGKPEPKTTAAFEDMPSNSDFRKAISWAVENDITSGIGNNKFGPNQTCKREHIVTLLYKAKDL